MSHNEPWNVLLTSTRPQFVVSKELLLLISSYFWLDIHSCFETYQTNAGTI